MSKSKHITQKEQISITFMTIAQIYNDKGNCSLTKIYESEDGKSKVKITIKIKGEEIK